MVDGAFACILPSNRMMIGTVALYPGGAMELTYVNPGAVRPSLVQQSWFKCDPSSKLPLPDQTRRLRVIGSNSVEDFISGGLTDFKRLAAAVRFYTGSGFTGRRVLDSAADADVSLATDV